MTPEIGTIETPETQTDQHEPITAESILEQAAQAERDAENADEDTGEDEVFPTHEGADGQIEITMNDTPLFKASEELVRAKANFKIAKEAFDQAEKTWLEEMEAVNKKQVKHKGDIIEAVPGRTIDDHARFKKS